MEVKREPEGADRPALLRARVQRRPEGDLRCRRGGGRGGLLPRHRARRRRAGGREVRPRCPERRPETDDRPGYGARGREGGRRRRLHRHLFPVRRGGDRPKRTPPVHPRTLKAAGGELLVHRTDDFGDPPHQDGGPDHHRPAASAPCPRGADRGHDGRRLGFEHHEGGRDEG